jgi:Phage terminase large subunit
MTKVSSIPDFKHFNPLVIPFQKTALNQIKNKFDYSHGTHEVLFSGALGSSKSLLLAHIIIDHCWNNPGAIVGIGRRSMKDLRGTLLNVVTQHLGGQPVEISRVSPYTIRFPNGSTILSFSWADKNYKNIRSYEFSLFAIEELTENKDDEAYREIYNRMGRLKHIKPSLLVCATNPDDPDHWVYKRFMLDRKPTRHVFYSKTIENPFLPASYVDQLAENLDSKMAKRLLEGEWLPIKNDVIYYAYDKTKNYVRGEYGRNSVGTIHVGFDFNISANNPLSYCFANYHDGNFHVFDEVVIETASTAQAIEEGLARGLFDFNLNYVIQGDAAGRARSTKSIKSDWDIVQEILSNYVTRDGRRLRFRMDIARSNPPIRERHNRLNAMFCNTKGVRKIFVYEKCKTLDEGLSLTKLKDGSNYLEKETYSQHITTALGYMVCQTLKNIERPAPQILRR